MKLKAPVRHNFSRSAKLCDQTFYHDSQPLEHPHSDPIIQPKPTLPRKTSTYAFSSVSRQKRGNFRFDIRLPVGEFTQYPNHIFGRRSSPNWSFSKTERYAKVPVQEFEVCERHPVLQQDEQLKMRASSTSISELLKDQIKTSRSGSYLLLRDKHSILSHQTQATRNYSIIQPRQTSQVGFFSKTKIQHPRYLSRQDLNEIEGQLDDKHYQQRIQPSPKGYIEFYKRRTRQANKNSKRFQTYLYSNTDENQFNNYSLTHYPLVPTGHLNMQRHLDRPDYTPARLGPNTEPYNIDPTRINQNHVDLHFDKFRDQVRTRYDRVGEQPNTRLDYQVPDAQLPGLLQMDRMLGRNPELFPVVDPAIKKAGDAEMQEQLKRWIPIKQINEAHRPKNVQNFSKVVKEGL